MPKVQSPTGFLMLSPRLESGSCRRVQKDAFGPEIQGLPGADGCRGMHRPGIGFGAVGSRTGAVFGGFGSRNPLRASHFGSNFECNTGVLPVNTWSRTFGSRRPLR